jgi:hypothetical protein
MIYFKGHALTMDGFCEFVHTIIEVDERTLCEDLMF